MSNTSFTSDQLKALESAYASGTLELTYEGKRIKYRSLDEMERAINTIRRELGRTSGTKRSRRVHLSSKRGLT